jgi:hypothetical protein
VVFAIQPIYLCQTWKGLSAKSCKALLEPI